MTPKTKYYLSTAFLFFSILFIFQATAFAEKDYSVVAPKGWKEIFSNTFSPFSENQDISKSMIQIVIKFTELNALSESEKNRILSKKKEMHEKVLSQKTKVINGVKTWDVQVKNRLFGKERMTHEIYLISKGRLCILTLTSAPKLFNASNTKFLQMVASFKLN